MRLWQVSGHEVQKMRTPQSVPEREEQERVSEEQESEEREQ